MLDDDFQSVIAKNICGETDDGRFIAGGVPRADRPQDLVTRHRIDPYAVLLHLAQHLRRGAGFHRIARLETFRARQKTNISDTVPNGPGVIEPEWCSDFFGELVEQSRVKSHRERRMMWGARARIKRTRPEPVSQAPG